MLGCGSSGSAACLVVAQTQRVGGDVRELDRQPRAARLPQERPEEQARATLALPEARHEDRREGDQPRPALTGRNPFGELRARRNAAARTDKTVQLLLGTCGLISAISRT